MEDNDKAPTRGDIAVQALPQDVMQSIDAQVEEVGGEWQEPPEYAGSVGRTMFDTPTSKDGSVNTLTAREQIEQLPRQSLVRVKSVADRRSYLGAVVQGPFAEPDGLRADAPILVTVTVRGGILMPKYHGRVQIEIIGEELSDGSIVPPRRRPLPNSPVFVLSNEETERVLRVGGDVRIGVMVGHEEIEVRVPSTIKAVLPRHIGVLGTTGGGKSTTVSGMVAQFQSAGVACIILDTEGEYTAICDPTEDPNMQRALERRGLSSGGVQDTHVLHLVGRETANPNHPDVQQFSLRFSELSPYAVMEILELSDAQQDRFLRAYDVTKLILERLGVFPTNDREREELIDLDEMETGYPRMTIGNLYDVVRVIASQVAKEPDPPVETKLFRDRRDDLKKVLAAFGEMPKSVPSWRALQGRIGRVKRLGIFDTSGVQPPNYTEMLQPGRVSIIDLSDTDSPQVNNLVIAQILRGIQRDQDVNYRAAAEKGSTPPRAMVFIEEAHEFLSAQRIKDMPVLFQQVARIARRGRKRWLGLAFITQLPQHLPDEVLGLINNWVLHKINDSNVVGRLRRSIGGIDESLWNLLPGLAPGQAIVSFTSLARPLMVTIDPTPCKLLMVE